MGKAYGICLPKQPEDGVENAIRDAAVLVVCAVFYPTFSSSILATVRLGKVVELDALLHDGTAVPYHHSLFRHSARTMYTYLGKLGDRSRREMLANEAHSKFRLGCVRYAG